MPPAGTPTIVERPLWLAVPGAPARVVVGWLAWLAAAGLAGGALAAVVGPGGAALALVVCGWLLAVALPAPTAWLRRYHLDDAELVVLGPGRRVQRLPWTLVETVTQTRATLRLVGASVSVDLALAPLVRSGEWASVLARIVPELATETWERIEDGEHIRLAAPLEPAGERVLWWAYAPAALASLAAAGLAGVGVVALVAFAERVLALCAARRRAVRVGRTGLLLRGPWRPRPVTWSELEVMRTADGLQVESGPGRGALLRVCLTNFWVALPVIELRARFGFHCPQLVAFRVRRADGGLAVVGEVEGGA